MFIYQNVFSTFICSGIESFKLLVPINSIRISSGNYHASRVWTDDLRCQSEGVWKRECECELTNFIASLKLIGAQIYFTQLQRTTFYEDCFYILQSYILCPVLIMNQLLSLLREAHL